MNRVPGVPQEPTIVFAGANAPVRIDPLEEAGASAVMASYLYIKPERSYPKVIESLDRWPTYRYLDSGVFTFVRKAGLTRIRIAAARKITTTPEEEFKTYAIGYIEWLKTHKDDWDFIIELDVDEMFGLERAMGLQKILHRVVGDKLLPAWHVQRGQEGWKDMIAKFPYVAIGSDTGVARSTSAQRPVMHTAILRDMVRQAHAAGVKVHYLGDTRYKTLREAELDTADSTSWVSAGRFGQIPGPSGSIRYTSKSDKGLARQKQSWARTIKPIDMSRARQFETYMESLGVDPQALLNGSLKDKMTINIKMLLLRQEELRRARARSTNI